jgi:hypothetical protein
MTPATTLAQAYYASKPPLMQGLYINRPGGPTGTDLTSDQITALINQCLAAGEVIDEQIDFWGWDPFSIMSDRLMQGILWVPAGLGNVTGTSVITPGEFAGPQPPGTIKSSVTLSDYPPYPVAPTPTPGVQPASVGAYIAGPYYQPTPGTLPPVGTIIGAYKLVQIPSGFMMGDGSMMTVWQKIQ